MSFELNGKKGNYDYYTWTRPCERCGKEEKGFDLYDAENDITVKREITESACNC